MTDFFFHTFWSPAFDCKSRRRHKRVTFLYLDVRHIESWRLMWHMTSTRNILTTKLCGLLYNQCIDVLLNYSFFIYPTGRVRVSKIRFVSTGENQRTQCLVCKKKFSNIFSCTSSLLYGKAWRSNCNDPKYSDRLVWTNSVDPDQTEGSGLHCLPFLLHLLDTLLYGKTTFFNF